MRTITFDGTAPALVDAAVPTPGMDEALIRVLKAGICNTDLEIFNGYMGFRGIPGHEFVGRVEQGDADWVGKRVVGEINIADGTCDFCQRGIPSQCRNRRTVGIDRHDGAFAEYMGLAIRNLHIVPDAVTDEQAVFVEPLAAALEILEAVHITPRDRVVVIGGGKLGLLAAQVVRLIGCEVLVVVRRQKPAMLLRQWGIRAIGLDDIPRNRATVVIDCTGNADGFADALNLVQARGTIVLKSTYSTMPTANLTRVAVEEIRVVGSRCGSFEAALRVLEAKLVDVESMIEARYPLERGMEAIQHAGEAGALKVVLEVS